MKAFRNLLNDPERRTIATRESGRPQRKFIKPESACSLRVNHPVEHQEKFIVKQYWRALLRWQGFDDYMYLRDPSSLRHIKGRDTLSKNDIVEEFNSLHL